MPNVGTISGSMYLDPSAYIAGLNQAAQSTQMFQAGVERVSFAGFHRGIFATTTLLYGLNRIMSSMSQGMEEYTNMLGRIGSVADMTAASVEALADSMKKLSVAQGVSRTDIMGGMYTAAQSGFSSPAEMRAMATSGALLSRASGKEIDVKKSVDLMSVARQALGIGQGAVTSKRMTDLLLRGRDVGRWELDEMAQALGIPLTVYGNQFASKIGGEETLRQLVAIMSTATLAGLNPRMAATGTRRLVERSIQLQHSKRGDELRSALRGIGFESGDPIGEAMTSPMGYLNTILKLTGGNTSELGRLGFGSRDLMVMTSALRENGGTLGDLYQQLSYSNMAGTTDKYNEKMKQTYDAKRDQLRAQWEVTSQEFMQASIPVIEQFTGILMTFNEIAQGLPASVKSFMMLVSSLAAMRLALNFLGFRSQHIGVGAAMGRGSIGALGSANVASLSGTAASTGFLRPNDPQAARLARHSAAAAARGSGFSAGFGGPSSKWVSPNGAPWGTSFSAFKPMMWNEIPLLDRSSGGGFGPSWYDVPRGDPMNYYQYQNMLATGKKWDLARTANNAKFWAPNGNPWVRPGGGQSTLTLDREAQLSRMGALARRYGVLDPALGTPISGAYLAPGSRTTPWGPTAEARIRWAAYKQGQSVDFDDGTYGSMSRGANAYSRRQPQPGSMSVREYRAALASLGASQMRMTSPFVSNIDRTLVSGDYGQIGLAQQAGRYVGASGVFSANGIGAKAAMYAGMGIGNSAQAIGQAISGITRFGSAIWSVVGPMAQFGVILTTLMKLFEGWSYSGSMGAPVNGKTRIESGGKMPALMISIGHGYKMMGSFLHNGRDYLGDMTADYARSEGYVPGFEGLGDGSKKPSKWDYTKTLVSTIFQGSPLGATISAIRGRPMGLAGYRKGTTKDAMADLRRELLTPGEVRQFSKKGGVNFDDFTTIRPYLKRYMSEQLNILEPDDWNAWMANTKNGYGKVQQWSADALRFYRGEIMGNIQRVADRDNGIWRASAPDDIKAQLMTERALRNSQWDIYKSADYATPNGNGSLNWDAGGRDYRKLYDAELARMDTSYGNFAASPYDNAQGRIDGLNAMWNKRAAANGMKFAGLGIDEETQFALKDAKGESERQKMLRAFLKVMPDIGTMDIESAKKWYTDLTGRGVGSDAVSKANFDNFRHMDLRNFIGTETVGKDLKYESTTQFGTAEAYNQLLPKQNAEEKIVFAMDKFEKYIETLKVNKAETDTAMSEVMKAAARFLKAAEDTAFFNNIAEIADNTGEL